jgi:cation diffusion facilitator family transporter
MHSHTHCSVHNAAQSSVVVAVLLTSLKIIVGLKTHSLGILAEATHSALDLIAALITLWAIKVSAIPADDDHHFGHGKIENLSALVETFLLWVTCGWITWEAFQRLTGGVAHPEIEPSVWAFGLLLLSIFLDYNRARILKKVSIEHDSPALAADALHFQSDIYSSLAVLLGLIIVSVGKAKGYPLFNLADSIAALVVAGWTFWVSLTLAKESFDQLMDKAPKGVEESILTLLRKLPEVLVISALKVRKSGPALFIDLTVGLNKTMSFEESHQVTDQIEDIIKENFPRVSVSVHAEPV